MEARESPKRIPQTDLANQVADLPRNGRAPVCGLATFPCPIYSKPFSVPSDDRFRLHDEQCGAPICPEAAEPNPEQSVCGVKTKPAVLRPLEDR